MSLPPSKPRSAAQPVAGDDHTELTSVPAPPWDGDDLPQDDADDTHLVLDPEGTKQTGVAIRSAAHATMPGRDDPDLESGTRLGEYRIQAKIGQGGMGVVYSAIHPLIGKGAAIKILKKELCADPHQLERFIDEARVVNQIGHPNIVDVFAFGEMPDGRSYLVMEWLKGETLRARIARSTMDAAEVNAIVRPLARALEAAHEKGVIHRDLKPDNVFLVPVRGEAPTVKLLDFGIAKLASNEHRVEKTATGAIVGTPQYIAPEQAKGYAIDHRADIYALGGIVYELLTGRPPFIADNAMEMVAKHLMETPLPPSHFAPGVAPELDALVLRMLAKTPDGRPSLTEVCEVVERAKNRASIPTPFAQVSSAPSSGGATPGSTSTVFLDEIGERPLSAELVRSNTSQPLTADASSPVERVSMEALSSASTSPGATSRPAFDARVSQPLMEEPVRRRMPLWIAILGVPLAGLAAFVIVSATGSGGGKAPSTTANTQSSPAAIEPTASAVPSATPTSTTAGSTTAITPQDAPVATPGSIVKAPAVTQVRPTQVDKAQLRLVISGARAPDIFIDGKRSSADVKLRPGLHEIEIRAPRMLTQKLHVDVAPNGTTKRIALVPRPRAETPNRADPSRKPESVKTEVPKKPDDDSELLSPGSLNNAPSRR